MPTLKRLGALSLSLVLALTAFTGCGAKGGSSSSSSDGSSSQVQAMDLSSVTDPFLSTAGLSGDTVVATVGDTEITADSLLYWLAATVDGTAQYYAMMGMSASDLPWDTEMEDGSTMAEGFLNNALQTAALYALVPVIAQQEGLSVSDESAQTIQQAIDSFAQQAGGDAMVDHMLWSSALTRDLYTRMMQAGDLNTQLMNRYYGDGAPDAPKDEDILTYVSDNLQIAYKAKHILLKTVDTSKPIKDADGKATGEYEPLDDATVAQKKATAEDILAQLQAASDKEALFDELMKEYSEDTDSSGNVNSPEGYEAKSGQMVAAFEEAALNIINHNEHVSMIDICLLLEEGSLIVRIRDDGAPFDPLAFVDDEDILQMNNIRLLERLTDQKTYTRIMNMNNTVLSIRLEAAENDGANDGTC